MANENIILNQYYYSPTTDTCYPAALYNAYIDSGTWPSDGIKTTEEIYLTYFVNIPEGKQRHWNASTKTFSWIDIPEYQYSAIEKQEIGRKFRNKFVFATDVMMLSDYTMNDTLLTDEQKEEIANTRIAFKVWPTTDNWWDTPLPTVPQWIIDDAAKNRAYEHPTEDQWPLPPFAS